MKINTLETHDRFLHFTKQSFDIGECGQDLINQRPFGDHHFYIFAHPRTDDDGSNKRLIWQPRILKPKAQINSMLFKAYPGTDLIKTIWILPPHEMWSNYTKGNMCENKAIAESIFNFIYNRDLLESPESDDPSPERAQQILFEYQPQLFRRETLPDEMKPIWDAKMAQRKLKHEATSNIQ